MRKIKQLVSLMLLASTSAYAGGYLTNTNQNAAFLRNFARNATTEIDGVYTNPAGLSFLEEGFHLSFNIQNVYQTRNIKSTCPLFGLRGDANNTRTYKGTASAPIVPSFQGAYKKDKWTISASVAVGGGGGKSSFDEGLPSFDALAIAGLYQKGLTPSQYTINTSMKGSQYIFGTQLGLSYLLTENLSAFVGGRMNYYYGNYEGYLNANLNANNATLMDLELDVDQTGWGLTPILGLDYKLGKLNLGLKYEFVTNLNIENDTHTNTVKDYIPSKVEFDDGYSSPSDLPAILTFGAQYDLLPSVRVMAGYTHFFDTEASMAVNTHYYTTKTADGTTTYGSESKGKQKYLKKGTTELTAGAEWSVTDRLLLSAGYMKTNYGATDNFQSDLAFSCDSYSVGFGGRLKLSDKVNLNVSYFFTNYDDYTKNSDNYNGTHQTGTDVYSRTNKVFSVGVDCHF